MTEEVSFFSFVVCTCCKIKKKIFSNVCYLLKKRVILSPKNWCPCLFEKELKV